MWSKKAFYRNPLKITASLALLVILTVVPLAFSPSTNLANRTSTSSTTASSPYTTASNSSESSSRTKSGTSIQINAEVQQPVVGFDRNDSRLISSMANQSAEFLVTLELPNGAIPENPISSQVYTRDLSLAIIALLIANRTLEATLGVEFLLGLAQGSSYFTSSPSDSTPTSPNAWYQIYSTGGSIDERSLRGEDQGMALFALATYFKATNNLTMISSNWSKIESAANFILYLQNTPGAHNGLYRHGDDWEDTRAENTNYATGKPIYWPYWPEYYQWEEENMRMIMGLKGAVYMAMALGFGNDAASWSASINTAEVGLRNESVYSKYEAYDYYGSVLWGLQTNTTIAEHLVSSIPAGYVSPYGIRDLAGADSVGCPDTIDYMTALVRVGNYALASHYLQILSQKLQSPFGGFYDRLALKGLVPYGTLDSYGASRFLYFESVALGVNENLTEFSL